LNQQAVVQQLQQALLQAGADLGQLKQECDSKTKRISDLEMECTDLISNVTQLETSMNDHKLASQQLHVQYDAIVKNHEEVEVSFNTLKNVNEKLVNKIKELSDEMIIKDNIYEEITMDLANCEQGILNCDYLRSLTKYYIFCIIMTIYYSELKLIVQLYLLTTTTTTTTYYYYYYYYYYRY